MKALAIFGIVILFCCHKMESEYTLYFLGKDKIPVTRIDSRTDGLKTYLCYGKVKVDMLPTSYLIVSDKTMLNGFQALLIYQDGKLILLQPILTSRKLGMMIELS